MFSIVSNVSFACLDTELIMCIFCLGKSRPLAATKLPKRKDLPAFREQTHTAYSAAHVIDTSHLW